MRKSILCGLFVFFALPAFAVDLAPRVPVKAPVVQPVPNWAGFYIGANGGYAWDGDGASALVNPSAVPLAPGYTITAPVPAPFGLPIDDPKGGFGGLQIGANAQSDRWVYGLEADIQFGSIKGDGSAPVQFNVSNPDAGIFRGTASFSQKLDWFATLRARLGYDFNPLLVYATGGLAIGHIKSTLSLTGSTFDIGGGTPVFVASTGSTVSTSDTRLGYALGAGAEMPLSPGWTFRGEYLFLSFDHDTNLSVAGASASSSGFDVHTVRAGLNYKFGGVTKY